MPSSLDYAGFAQLCGRSLIMCKIMHAYNHVIPRSLPLSIVQFISLTEVVTKSITKNRNAIFFAKSPEAEIWTCVHRWYLTSFAGLHFENEPGLTELDTAE